jgi:hypothetical protein
MRKFLTICFIFVQSFIFSQTDYSSRWEDFFAYNNVTDFYQTATQIIALSDNALFIYNKNSQEIEKISSVNGLSGESTSSIFYSESLQRIVIGYKSGLLEIVDADRKVHVKPDIVNFSILGEKSVNHMAANGNDLYLSTPFGIVVFDLETLNFKSTFFIGSGSTEVYVNEIAFHNNTIYAATKQGFYTADLNDPFLIDFNNWTQHYTAEFSNLEVFNNQVYGGTYNNLHRINTDFTLTPIFSFSENITDIRTSGSQLTLSTAHLVKVLDSNFNTLQQVTSNWGDPYYFTAQTAQTYNNELFIGTTTYGILRSGFANITQYSEIHPEGPLSNEPFSISVLNENLWVVFGGYNDAYTPQGSQFGISHFNGTHWINIPFASDKINYRDLVHVNIDPNHENKVYVSSWNDGIIILEDDAVTTRWNHLNSGLENLYTDGINVSIRIGSSIFDQMGNLWVANSWVTNRLKKFSTSGQWSGYNLNAIFTNPAFGLNEMIIDQSGNKWIGTRRNGALVINENASKIMGLTTDENKGDLPDLNVRCLAVDRSNKIWIGTRAGMRVFDSSANIFDLTSYAAKAVFIAYGQDDGFGEALLGNQNINSIAVDGADNKWFGTDGAGVLCTNSSGKETLFQFDKTNSPLPSNKILKIRFDATTGMVFFATDKGIVAYNSGIAPYGEALGEVYAYPNPVKSNHEFVTIDGRNGTHIPYGTNVKILDAAGKLVFETNVEEGQEEFGGKVVWNKTNLAGHKVASGVYLVLLYEPDNAEVSSTKIAIIN